MKTLLATASALILTAGVAFAATPTPPPVNQGQPGEQNQSAPVAKPTDMQQQVKNNLTKAGFTDIKIMPEYFLVRAKDQQGNAVMMVMNPDSFTEITTIDQKQTAATNKMNDGQGGSAKTDGVQSK